MKIRLRQQVVFDGKSFPAGHVFDTDKSPISAECLIQREWGEQVSEETPEGDESDDDDDSSNDDNAPPTPANAPSVVMDQPQEIAVAPEPQKSKASRPKAAKPKAE